MMHVVTRGMEEAERMLQGIPGAVPRATSRAINRAMTQTRTEAVRRVRAEYHGKASDIRDTMRIQRASPGSLHGMLESVGSPIRLTQFRVTPRQPTAGMKRKRAVNAAVLKRGGGTIRGAFVARMSSGFIGVFNRGTKARLPIYNRYGPSAAQMLSKDVVQIDVEDKMVEVFTRRLDHEINNILGGILA